MLNGVVAVLGTNDLTVVEAAVSVLAAIKRTGAPVAARPELGALLDRLVSMQPFAVFKNVASPFLLRNILTLLAASDASPTSPASSRSSWRCSPTRSRLSPSHCQSPP